MCRLDLQALGSEVDGSAEGDAGVAAAVEDVATAEVAGAEMVAAPVMVTVCGACKFLYNYTPTVTIRDTIHGGVNRKVGQLAPVWLAGR